MKVLITTLGSSGDLNPLLGVGLELQKQGHQIGFATSLYFKEQIEKHNFIFYEVFPNLDPRSKELIEFVTDPINGPEKLLKKYILPGLEKSYQMFMNILDDYDIVLSATLTYYAPIACRVKNKPWISVCLSPMLFFSAYDPPIFAALPSLKNLYFSPRFNKRLLDFLLGFSSSWLKPHQQLWKKVGLKGSLNPILKEGFSPYGTLALFSPEFGKPQPDWPQNTYVTGFIFYDKSLNVSNKEKLQQFLEKNPKPVLFTLGTTTVMNPGKMFDIFVETQKKTDFPCIILTGKENLEKYKKHENNKVFVTDFISYSLVMPHCSLIVHQGGVGTTAQAMRSGNPMIVLPHCNDQYDNAHRVDKLGISLTLPYKRLSTKKLSLLIRQAINSDEMKLKAKAISQKIQKENGEQRAIEFIEKVLSDFRKTNQ